jgi:hypothetical protein
VDWIFDLLSRRRRRRRESHEWSFVLYQVSITQGQLEDAD